MLLKTRFELLGQSGDLSAHLGDHGHVGRHRRPHGVRDDGGGVELLGAQRCLDLDGSLLDASLAAAPAQGSGNLGAGQAPTQRRRRGDA